MEIDLEDKRDLFSFLDPQILRPRLMVLAIYIAAFEILKDTIIDRIRSFFSVGFTLDAEKYDKEVLSLNRSVLYASLAWHRAMNAIDDADLATFERVKQQRNEFVHTLAHVATQGLPNGIETALEDVLLLLRKIETWWIANVELPSNPEYDNVEITEDKIVPGSILAFKMLIDVALGDEEVASQHLAGVMELMGQEENTSKPHPDQV